MGCQVWGLFKHTTSRTRTLATPLKDETRAPPLAHTQKKTPPHLAERRAQRQELGVEAVVEGLERLGVLGVADEPVDRGEVLALRELLVQAPEDLLRDWCGWVGGWAGGWW